MPNGPGSTVWVPGPANTDVFGATTIRYTSGELKKRGCYKIFIAPIGGVDISISTNLVRNGYCDQRMDDGLYAIFGSADAGDVVLKLWTSPIGQNIWTEVASKTFTFSNNTNVPSISPQIFSWAVASPNGALASQAVQEEHYTVLIAKAKELGLTQVYFNHDPLQHKGFLYGLARANGINLEHRSRRIFDTKGISGMGMTTSYTNRPILTLDAEFNNVDDAFDSHAGGGMMGTVDGVTPFWQHPNMSYLTLPEEPGAFVGFSAETINTMCMVARANFPSLRLRAFVHADDAYFPEKAKMPFLDTNAWECYPFSVRAVGAGPSYRTNVVGDFSSHWGYTSADPARRNCIDYLNYVFDADRTVPAELIVQQHVFDGSPYRLPHPNETSALVFQGVAAGATNIGYFLLNDIGGGFPGLYDKGAQPNNHAMIDKIKSINAKLASWSTIMAGLIKDPQSTDLRIDYSNPATTYELFGGVMGGFHNPGGVRYVVVVNTDCLQAKDVVCRVSLYPSGLADVAVSQTTGKAYRVSGGKFTVLLKPGDADLFAVY